MILRLGYPTRLSLIFLMTVPTLYAQELVPAWIWTKGCVDVDESQANISVNYNDNSPETCFNKCGHTTDAIVLKTFQCGCFYGDVTDIMRTQRNFLFRITKSSTCPGDRTVNCGCIRNQRRSSKQGWSLYIRDRSFTQSSSCVSNLPTNGSGCVSAEFNPGQEISCTINDCDSSFIKLCEDTAALRCEQHTDSSWSTLVCQESAREEIKSVDFMLSSCWSDISLNGKNGGWNKQYWFGLMQIQVAESTHSSDLWTLESSMITIEPTTVFPTDTINISEPALENTSDFSIFPSTAPYSMTSFDIFQEIMFSTFVSTAPSPMASDYSSIQSISTLYETSLGTLSASSKHSLTSTPTAAPNEITVGNIDATSSKTTPVTGNTNAQSSEETSWQVPTIISLVFLVVLALMLVVVMMHRSNTSARTDLLEIMRMQTESIYGGSMFSKTDGVRNSQNVDELTVDNLAMFHNGRANPAASDGNDAETDGYATLPRFSQATMYNGRPGTPTFLHPGMSSTGRQTDEQSGYTRRYIPRQRPPSDPGYDMRSLSSVGTRFNNKTYDVGTTRSSDPYIYRSQSDIVDNQQRRPQGYDRRHLYVYNSNESLDTSFDQNYRESPSRYRSMSRISVSTVDMGVQTQSGDISTDTYSYVDRARTSSTQTLESSNIRKNAVAQTSHDVCVSAQL